MRQKVELALVSPEGQSSHQGVQKGPCKASLEDPWPCAGEDRDWHLGLFIGNQGSQLSVFPFPLLKRAQNS